MDLASRNWISQLEFLPSETGKDGSFLYAEKEMKIIFADATA